MPTVTHSRRSRLSGGFTLNELVVSIAILALLMSLLIANFQRGRLSDDLRVSAQNLAANLRRMQNLSTVGQSVMTGTGERVPPGGYGVSMEWTTTGSYELFADVARRPVLGNCQSTTPADANSEYEEGIDCDALVEAQTVSLRPDVVFWAVQVGTGVTTQFGSGSWTGGPSGDNDERVDIAFKPPKPIPYLDGTSGISFRIELKHMRTNQTRTIIVIGASGQISERAGSI
ncbi:MAG: prepilin-type N-terminal cleavage/methylation domain-containing protein [Candidatus Kerfeldbacteria bacterium]|nr:prepilin-type N-terminal cleavage/methylation domain-containing protein [Candidatus Kerfeldbacteria bacterium]